MQELPGANADEGHPAALTLPTTVSARDVALLRCVNLLNCGGTINMAGATARQPSAGIATTLPRIKRAIADLRIEVEYEDLFKRAPDSSNIGAAEWELIIQRLRSLAHEKANIASRLREFGISLAKGGIVVCHGTDTLAATSYATTLELSGENLQIPIVFTGSHSPPDQPGSDAQKNLLKSLWAAQQRFDADATCLPPGVFVLIGQEIHLASRITKVHTEPDSWGRYISSFPAPIGRITLGKSPHLRVDQQYLDQLRGPAGTQPPGLRLNASSRKPWGIVEHMVLDHVASPIVVDDFKRRINFYRSQRSLERRGIGLVVQGNFLRNPSFEEFKALFHGIAERQVVVLFGSRRVYDAMHGPGHSGFGLVPKSMTHAAARTKLAWVLRYSRDPGSVLAAVSTNISGDVISAEDSLPDWITYETFPDLQPGTEVVLAYPDIHAQVIADAINRLKASSSNRRKLFLYGFGDGHLPTVNHSLLSLVNSFLSSCPLGAIAIQAPLDADAPSLWDAQARLAKVLTRLPKARLLNFLESTYCFDEDALRRAIRQHTAQGLIQEAKITLAALVADSVAQFMSAKPQDFAIQRLDEAIGAFQSTLRISIPTQRIKDTEEIPPRKLTTMPSSEVLSLAIDAYPEAIAARLLKDAVMAASPLLAAIGAATDVGMRVIVKSLAVRTESDLSKYEVGSFLRAVGAESDHTAPWATQVAVPLSPTPPDLSLDH